MNGVPGHFVSPKNILWRNLNDKRRGQSYTQERKQLAVADKEGGALQSSTTRVVL
jgi:hypothetical protein